MSQSEPNMSDTHSGQDEDTITWESLQQEVNALEKRFEDFIISRDEEHAKLMKLLEGIAGRSAN